jgi:amino acid adenylation domain-containing protein
LHDLNDVNDLVSAFEWHVDRSPNEIAVESSRLSLTYRVLDHAANVVAHTLVQRGVRPGDLVCVAAQRSVEGIVAMLGALKAGAAYVPVDPTDPPAHVGFILRDTNPRVVVTPAQDAEQLREHRLPIVPLDLAALVAQVQDEAATRIAIRPAPDALAYVVYTSGSTGRPKGVMVEHRLVVQRLRGARHLMPGLREGMLQVNRPDFDTQTWEVWGAFVSGARLVVAPVVPDPDAVASLIEGKEIGVALLSPGLFGQLVETHLKELGLLRLVLVGGDVLSPGHARRFVEVHPGRPLVNLYGPTEAIMCCSQHEVEYVGPNASVPIGHAVGDSRLYLLDDAGQPVPPGEIGELVIGGECLARGYLRRPNETADRFVPDPFSGQLGARMYKSGDRARLNADGEFEFLGRGDDQVKIRGYRIEPGEVETCVCAAPGVLEATVAVREDLPGHKRLVAYVVLETDSEVVRDGTRRFVERQLPQHMVPSAFVFLGELPRTTRGKLDRSALPQPSSSALANEDSSAEGRQTDTERRLGQIWQEILQVEQVRAEDQFLELGGDSLLAVRVVVAVREELGVELALREVFDLGTLGELAGQVDAIRRSEALGDAAQDLPPLEVSERRHGSIPVTLTQAQACLVSELAEEALPYQVQALVHFKGRLVVEALVDSLSRIIERHELLHTRFVRRSGAWRQDVVAPVKATVPLVDLRSAADPDATLRTMVAEMASERIALDVVPLARWKLVTLADDHHVLIHVEHHLIHDGWSWNVFLRELTAHYRAATEPGTETLPALTLQFADFAQWQAKVASSSLGVQQQDYWCGQLADPPAPLALPSDRPRPRRQSFRGDQFVTDLPDELTARLRSLGGDNGATLFMTMLSGFYVLLSRYADQDDIIVGSGVANRRFRPVEKLIGMVLNTVALRGDLSGDPTGLELLRQVRQTTIAAYANQDLPFEHVLRAVAPARFAGAAPLYQVLFSFQDPIPVDLELPGLSIVPDETVGNQSAKADLNIIVINPRRASDPLRVVWQYSTDLFDRKTAEAMRDSYLALLDALTRDPAARISELAATTEQQRKKLLEMASGSQPSVGVRSVTEVFEATTREHADDVALLWDGDAMTYRELNEGANRLAHRLVGLGAGPGTRVAVAMERSPEAVVALLAVLKARSAYVAVDLGLPAERLRQVLEDADPVAMCVASSAPLERLSTAVPLVAVDDASLRDEPCDNLERPADPEDLAYIAYTSGSSGVPKGVLVPHRGVVGLVRGTDYLRFSGETFLLMAPLGFDASTLEIWGPLLNGGRLAVAPPTPLGPEDIGEVVVRLGVTTLWMTAGLFHKVVELTPDALRPLHQVLAGGDVLSPDHVAKALRFLAPDAVLVNGYGPTEGTTFTCCHTMVRGELVDDAVPIGRPIAGRHVYITDAHGGLVPPGVAGELLIGGSGVALGYHNEPELTGERFVADDFGPDGTKLLYRSGDRARWRRDETIEFLGRIDRQVKIRGFRVEPEAVERVLLEHPRVREAVVVTDSKGGDAGRRLLAFVAAAESEPVSADEVRAYLRERLAPYEIPSAIVVLDALPLTPNGKIDTDALPDLTFNQSRGALGATPRDALERALLKMWCQVLGIESISPLDDFFDLGGHSLMAVTLFALIEKDTGLRLPLSMIFEAPTVRQMAEVLRSNGWATPWRSLATLTKTGSRLPVFFVTAGDGNSVGFGPLARQLGPDQPFFALQPRGLDGRRLIDTGVTQMARRYVHDIRGVQPSGPYILGGRCFGTLVAFEMTRLLEAAGEQVLLLIALDSVGPLWTERVLANGLVFDECMNLAKCFEPGARPAQGDIFGSTLAAEQFVAWLSEPVDVHGDAVVTRYIHAAYRARPDLQVAYPLSAGRHIELLDWTWIGGRSEMGMQPRLIPPPRPEVSDIPPSVDPRSRTWSERFGGRVTDWLDVVSQGRVAALAERRQGRLLELASRMVLEYRAGPIAAPVGLIRSEEYRNDAQLARWYGVETGGIEEIFVRGSHQSMMREPDVRPLARCVEACVDRVMADGIGTRH